MNPFTDISLDGGVLSPELTISCGEVTTSSSSPSFQQITLGKVHFAENAELGNDFSPGIFDIICGRDRLAFNHPGNRRFRVIVKTNRERYQTCKTRDQKSKITNEIIDSIQEKGNFLQYDHLTELWCVVTRNYAHEKVSHALRSAKDPSKKTPRKKRGVRKKSFTPEEDETFRQLLAAQQKIFQGYVGDEIPAPDFAIDISDIDEVSV